MSGTSDWEKACDHVMPSVCRPVNSNPTRRKAKGRGAQASPVPAYPEYSSDPVEEKPSQPKIRINVRIGVFFDGTGNNASNTALGQACGAQHPIRAEDLDASCKPYMSDPDSSYGGDVSNVYKLFDRYQSFNELGSEGSSRLVLRKAYVEGIGTKSGEKDRLVGSGMGRGDTGVVGRVRQAFTYINDSVAEIIREHPDGEIASLTFDTFGFSRGAAAARHFANEVALVNRGLLRDVLNRHSSGFGRTFLDLYKSDINMGFIGLFDTVASIAGLANLGNVRSSVAPGLRLYLPRTLFSNVVHLVARDEYRANFPLSRVKPDHPEIEVPGAHSDVGGGYQAEVEECVLVGPMQGLTVSSATDVTTTSIYRDAQQHRARMVAQGWPATMLQIVTPEPTVLAPDPQDRFSPREQRVYAGLQLKRPVQNGLSRVYLRVMHELAKRNGVRFDDIPDTPDYQMPAELQSLCKRFVAGDYSVTPTEEVMLKLRYIHTSAHWNHPLDKSARRETKLLYINAPTADAVRVQHPHVPG